MPAIVTSVDPEKGRHLKGQGDRQTAAEDGFEAARAQSEATQPASVHRVPASDARKSAIAIARKPGSWRGNVPDMTPEEHKRRGDALFREMKRKIAAALRCGNTKSGSDT